MLLPLALTLAALAAAPAQTTDATATDVARAFETDAVDVAFPAALPGALPALDLGGLVDDVGGIGDDDGATVATRRKPVRRSPVRRPPAADRRPKVSSQASPLNVGLAGAGGAAIGASLGMLGIGVAGAFATQLAGPQPPEVVLATAALAIGIAVATPFMAGLGGGAGVLLADERSTPQEWQGLLQCAASGYCAGLAAVAGPILGGGVGCSPQGCMNLPGPDRPAEWTAGAAIAGLVGGALVGVVGGYTLAPDKNDPTIAIGVGGIAGSILGSALGAGLAGGVATFTRP